MRYGLVIIMVALLVACSGRDDTDKGHVWKEQTDMLDKAKGVEDMLDKSSQQQRQQIDEVAQ